MPSRRPLAVALALCLGLAARLPAPAQGTGPAPPAPDEGFSESIDVDVVNLQIFVVDGSGQPVTGLGRGDFELRVDGQPVPITNFYAGAEALPPAPGAPAAPPAQDAAGAERLNLALFVDNVHMSAPGRYRALQALEKFFRGALHRQDRVILASYDGVKLVILRPPPGDVDAIVVAFRGIASTRSLFGHTAAAEVSGRDLEGPARDAEREAEEGQREMLASEGDASGHLLLSSLVDFVGSVAGLPGRKAVLYLTESLPAATDDPLFQALVRRASAERVTLYGLGALEPEVSIGSQLEQTLYRLAAPTGGLWGVNLYHSAALLDRIRGDLSSYYSLGFTPASPPGGKSHRLEVRVPGHPGLTVRFPESYAVQGREERLGGRAVAALDLGVADNPLGVRLAITGERPAPHGNRLVSLLVELPLAKLTLVPGQGARPERAGKMALVAIARDAEGRRLPPQRATVPIHIDERRLSATAGQTAAYRLVFELPPGVAAIAVALSDELGGQESVVVGHYAVGGGAKAVKAARPRLPDMKPDIRPDIRPDMR